MSSRTKLKSHSCGVWIPRNAIYGKLQYNVDLYFMPRIEVTESSITLSKFKAVFSYTVKVCYII